MLRKKAGAPRQVVRTRGRLSRSATRSIWLIAMLDCMTLIWMVTVGRWLDDQDNLLSIATLNGHHQIVVAVVAVGVVVLAALAPVTRGFSEGSDLEIGVLVVVCFACVVAMSGLLALLLPLLLFLVVVGIASQLI
jgi:lysylphosphatidylglycerol synthetase-like protein (DUF2156 family)